MRVVLLQSPIIMKLSPKPMIDMEIINNYNALTHHRSLKHDPYITSTASKPKANNVNTYYIMTLRAFGFGALQVI